MTRLALDISRLQPRYDVVVVGSGYGGGVAAARLAQLGKSVCVLERGKELRPGEYPRDEIDLLRQTQMQAGAVRLGAPTALFDIRLHKDINVLVGCGLGGTSLINASIALRPRAEVFAAAHWPAALRQPGVLAPYFARAEDMLKPATVPEWTLARPAAMQAGATALAATTRLLPLTINFEVLPNGINHVGVVQQPCVGCGDCVTGCNYGAKNTVLMNYLPRARHDGAEIFTEVAVRHVERGARGWRLACRDATAREIVVEATIVVLAAGTLGSTELLLRSRERGLALSRTLGTRFSGNGDTVGFAWNGERTLDGCGLGKLAADATTPVGPCSTTGFDLHAAGATADDILMVDGTIPGALGRLLGPMLAAGTRLLGENDRRDLGARLRAWNREWTGKLRGARAGALRHTLFMLAVGHDDAGGILRLDNDRLTLSWPDVGRQAHFARASTAMRAVARVLGARYLPNPVWNRLTDHSLITGHPLGGCPMADDAAHGVVNHAGQVYRDETGTTVHDGLYVMDGAVVPGSLGANPGLAIAALAERACELLARERGWGTLR